MKNILKLSLVSLCAFGAIFSTQAKDNQSASNIESDKQLVVTEPAGANASTSISSSSSTQSSTYQSSSTSMQNPTISEASGAAIGGPSMVTGREQDAYANCILHRYQAGKGSARVTDEHYWNNVQSDRLYAQYPASGGLNQNVAYNSSSGSGSSSSSSSSSDSSSSSQPMASSSSCGSAQMGEYWYGPGGAIYKSSTSSERVNEPAGSNIKHDSSSDQGSSSSSSSGLKSSGESKKGAEQQAASVKEPAGAESSATQSSTSGDQSSTESKSSQSQPGTATQEAAGANSGTTQSSTSGGAADMSEKVRSTLKSDTTLSPISSNVMVQDQNGKVALSGTVKSEAEKQQIVSKAEETAGSGNVIDNLQIKSDSSNP